MEISNHRRSTMDINLEFRRTLNKIIKKIKRLLK